MRVSAAQNASLWRFRWELPLPNLDRRLNPCLLSAPRLSSIVRWRHRFLSFPVGNPRSSNRFPSRSRGSHLLFSYLVRCTFRSACWLCVPGGPPEWASQSIIRSARENVNPNSCGFVIVCGGDDAATFAHVHSAHRGFLPGRPSSSPESCPAFCLPVKGIGSQAHTGPGEVVRDSGGSFVHPPRRRI